MGQVRKTVSLAGHDLLTALTSPAQPRGVLVLAHGRINDLDHPSLIAAAAGAVQAGLGAMRFNFPYRQHGREEPEPLEVLALVHAAAAGYALTRLGLEPERLVMAGKSLGARTAVEAVLSGLPARGLVFLGFPLHPPGRPDQLRDGPLRRLENPVLFIQGEHDQLCDPDLLGGLAAEMAHRPRVAIAPGADHGFGTPDGDHDPQPATLALIKDAVRDFLNSLL